MVSEVYTLFLMYVGHLILRPHTCEIRVNLPFYVKNNMRGVTFIEVLDVSVTENGNKDSNHHNTMC